MPTIKRRRTDISDILPQKIYKITWKTCMVITIIMGILGFVLVMDILDIGAIEEHNEEAEKFNQLSQSERECVLEFTNYKVDENLFMEIKDVELDQNIKSVILNIFIKIGIFEFIVIPCINFIGYWKNKSKDYHLADLPFARPYGWLLLISLIGLPWLVLFVARIDMHRQIKKFHQDVEKSEQTSATVTERINVQDLYEFFRQTAKNSDQKELQNFIDYAPNRYIDAHRQKIRDAQENFDAAKSHLDYCSGELQRAQRRLNEAGAALRQAKRNAESIIQAQNSANAAIAEWQAIQEMRGVIKMSTKDKSHIGRMAPFLFILVRVCVPYHKRVYDFGDYKIKLYPDCTFTCKRKRSGLIATYETRSYPDYTYSDKTFCFGNRRNNIERYLCRGQIVEAVTLMIDCLHSTNNAHEEKQIPKTFREVTSIAYATDGLLEESKEGNI